MKKYLLILPLVLATSSVYAAWKANSVDPEETPMNDVTTNDEDRSAFIDLTTMIAAGDLDVAIVGGAEAPVCPLGLSGFIAARSLSKNNDAPERASCPWDDNRDGFVLSEGAGILVIEDYEITFPKED